MADQEQSANVRRPQPDAAEQDPRAAAVQRQIRSDTEEMRQDEARMRASTPAEVSEKTVAEIAEDAEERAKR